MYLLQRTKSNTPLSVPTFDNNPGYFYVCTVFHGISGQPAKADLSRWQTETISGENAIEFIFSVVETLQSDKSRNN